MGFSPKRPVSDLGSNGVTLWSGTKKGKLKGLDMRVNIVFTSDLGQVISPFITSHFYL